MIRSRFAALCLSLVLPAACGQKFSASAEVAGAGGDVSTAGASTDGGSASAGRAGFSGGPGEAGTAGLVGNAGTNTGGGGAGGGAGAGAGGGPPLDPPIPVLGLALWLSADYGVLPKGGPVKVWQDRSGNQANATQAVVNVRPHFSDNGLGGKPTIEFSGGQFLTMPPGFGDFSKGLAGFMVIKPADPKCASVIELSNGSEIDDIALSFFEGKWGYEVLTEFHSGGTVETSKPSLYAVVQRPTGAVDLTVNGDLIFQAPYLPPAAVERQENFVGNTLYKDCGVYQGQISEIILYQRFVTEKEIVTIETYLREHWALPVGPTPTPQL